MYVRLPQPRGIKGALIIPAPGTLSVIKLFFSGTPRPLGLNGKKVTYQKGFVLDAEENREVEFKSLTSAQPSALPWKIMEKAKSSFVAA